MKSTSSSVARGRIVTSAGRSVVPAMVAPSHGRTKTTRPSFVLGTISPALAGLPLRGGAPKREAGHQRRTTGAHEA